MQGGGIAVINGKKGDGRGSAGVIVSGNGTRSRTMHSLAFFLLGEVYRRGHTTKPIILSVLLQSPTLSLALFSTVSCTAFLGFALSSIREVLLSLTANVFSS